MLKEYNYFKQNLIDINNHIYDELKESSIKDDDIKNILNILEIKNSYKLDEINNYNDLSEYKKGKIDGLHLGIYVAVDKMLELKFSELNLEFADFDNKIYFLNSFNKLKKYIFDNDSENIILVNSFNHEDEKYYIIEQTNKNKETIYYKYNYFNNSFKINYILSEHEKNNFER